jgi:hypothetical protein
MWIAWTIAISIWFVGAAAAVAQISEAAPENSESEQPGLKKLLSDRPFFGTQPVLSLGGDYVNTPREDFLETGMWNLPLTLDQMDGVIAEVAFGDGKKQGEWQLSYHYKVMAMDSGWQAIADSNAGLTLSDRRSQVLKASYNIRDWWKLGFAAVVEDRTGTDAGADPYSFGLNSRESLGFQINTLLKF